jgi:hypothetical protein
MTEKGDEYTIPEVCKDGGVQTANFFENLGMGFANLLGIGSVASALGAETPQDKLNGAISKLHQDTQNLINNSTLVYSQRQNDIDEDILNLTKKQTEMLQTEINFTKDTILRKITYNDIYIAGILIIIMIMIAFM